MLLRGGGFAKLRRNVVSCIRAGLRLRYGSTAGVDLLVVGNVVVHFFAVPEQSRLVDEAQRAVRAHLVLVSIAGLHRADKSELSGIGDDRLLCSNVPPKACHLVRFEGAVREVGLPLYAREFSRSTIARC